VIQIKSDKKIMSEIENILLRKRNFVSKIPEKAVFLFSGGFDSTAAIAYIIENWGTEIFPLFINRGQSNIEYEKEAVKHFEKILIERYPDKFNKVKEINVNIPAIEIKKDIPKKLQDIIGHPMRNPIMELYGVQYASTLDSVKTVLIASTPTDNYAHSQLATLRSLTISACMGMDDWNWQITTPLKDPFLGKNISKKGLADWAIKNNFNFDQTRSCIENSKTPCGKCVACKHRKEIYEL